MATYSLSASGTQALTAGSVALNVTISTLPASSGHGGAEPLDYYGVGVIRPGNATAFWEPFTVCGGPQWLPLPNGTTRIGYSLAPSAVVSVTEVFGSSPLAFPLASLPDVALASVADAQVLTYQASSSKWINATPTGGGGSGSGLGGSMAQLAADVTITPANTFVDGPSLSLVAGTWLLIATASVAWANNSAYTLKIWNGTTNGASAHSTNANSNFALSCSCVVVLASTQTWKMSIAASTSGNVLKAAAPSNPAGNTATTLSSARLL